MAGDTKFRAEYECGRLAHFLNFGRDDYDDTNDEAAIDLDAKAAWQRGWDSASPSQPTGSDTQEAENG